MVTGFTGSILQEVLNHLVEQTCFASGGEVAAVGVECEEFGAEEGSEFSSWTRGDDVIVF